jgi:DNA-binding SARP family transcriptional activator/energy-coupling factor transporter ATP-binding protein EcfA2
MDPVILLEKVRRPDPRGLVRERLDRLTLPAEGGASMPVTLILGPPGSGKTTLLSHIASAADDASAWYRVGNEDDSEVALTRHLGHTLGAAWSKPSVVQAAASGRITDLVRGLDDPEITSAQLVIDDLHEISGTPAEEALESFLTLRPRRVRVALGSRRPPRMNTSRMLVSGELTQLDGEQLRFRSWEVEQLFRSVYNSPLSPEAASALTRRTGGWAAGLQLFHLATAHLSRSERERAVEELSGRSRLIRSYLARNVVDGLPRERRRFLVLTSTLGVLTGDLCDALLGTSGSAAVLSEFEREQFFTTSTDAGLTYHYHQVLQTHLEVLLVDELGGQAARSLYARSGDLLEQAERPGAAIRAYARAEDWASVARLLQPASALAAGDEALWGMLSLPGAPIDDPALVLAGARRLARRGRISESVAAFRQAETLLDDPDFCRRCALERSAIALWLPGPALPPMPTSDEPESSLLRLSTELRQLTLNVRKSSTSTRPLVRGIALLLTGNRLAASRQLQSLRLDGASSIAWESLVADLAGRIADLSLEPDEVSAGRLEEITLSADVQGWPWLSRIARGLQAAMLLAAAPHPWRIAAATELLDDLDRTGDRWATCLTSIALGAVLGPIDESALARRALQRAADVARELDAPVLEAWARVLSSSAAVAAGEPDAQQQETAALRTATALGLTDIPDAVAALTRPEARHSTSSGSSTSSDSSTSSGTEVAVHCLGGFSLAVAGAEVPWRALRPRVRSLLMLLAMNSGHPLHREFLVDALWPDATLSSGIRSLQVAVSSIRQCLNAAEITEDALPRLGDAYALQLPAVFDQLAEFQRLTREAGRPGHSALHDRLAALNLYAGDLLPEVGPAEWVVEERSRLRLLAASVAYEAARDAVAAGDLRVALDVVRRSVDLDPYHDPSWQLIIGVCEQSGDFSAAVVARREQSRVWLDLGLVPPTAMDGRWPAVERRL